MRGNELNSRTPSRTKGGLYIPEPWKPSAPGKTRILSALLQEPKTYSYIKADAQLQDPSLIKYLRELLREGLIEKDLKTRAYSITLTGKNYLVIDKLAASVNSLTSASTLREESPFLSDSLITRVGDYQRLVVFAGPDDREFKRRIQEAIKPFVKDNLILYDSETSRTK